MKRAQESCPYRQKPVQAQVAPGLMDSLELLDSILEASSAFYMIQSAL